MGKLKVKLSVARLGDRDLFRAGNEDAGHDEHAAQPHGGVATAERRGGTLEEEASCGPTDADADAFALEEEDEEEAADAEDGDAAAVEQELAAMAALGLPVSFTCGSGPTGDAGGLRSSDAGGARRELSSEAADGSAERVRCPIDGWLQSYDVHTCSLFYHRQSTSESVWQLPPGELCHHPLPADQLAWAAAHASSLAHGPPQEQEEGDGGVVTLHGRSLQPCGTHTRFTEEAADGDATQAACPHDKYWAQRYRFFSRFDDGCRVTGDMWFSVTPEVVAIHQARRLARLVHGGPAKGKHAAHMAGKVMLVLDAFAGCGGNAIACAREHAYVVACDLSPLRLAETQHNAGVYGVAQYVDCVAADWTSLAEAMARHRRSDLAQAVFMSPPWGGPAYLEADTFDLPHAPLAGGQTAKQLLRAALGLAPAAAVFLPRNVRLGDVVQMATEAGADRAVMEQAVLNGKFKAVTVYTSRKWDPSIFCIDV